MKKMLMFALMIALLSTVVFGQIFIDPATMVEAKEYAYRVDAAPTIDGNESEWSDIPWTEIRYNDRDFNDDGIIDPMCARTDYRARYKAAWVSGSNKIYFLYEVHDDYMYTSDTIRTSHNDNMSVRLDPYDEEIGGEPMDDASKHSFSIRFQMDNGENTGYEGNDSAKPDYVTAVSADEDSKRYLLEVELTLPSDVVLSENYIMGYYPLFSDNDPEDDSPDNKNTVPMLWPQAYCPAETNTDYKTDQNVLAPDVFWRNDYYWGNIECIELNVVEVGAGESIQSAVDAASEGTIIKLAAGTYTENVTINTPKITLMGSEDGTTQIIPATAADPIITIADLDAAYGVIIENILFGEAEVTYEEGIAIGSAQANILNNEFYYIANPIYMAVTDSSYGYAPVIEDNVIAHSSEGGIKVNAPHASIRYNTISEQTGGYAIDSKGTQKGFCVDMGFNTVFNHHGECAIGNGGQGTFVIHHNYLVRSEELYGAGDTTGDDGIENQDDGGSKDYILNNTIVGWKSDGIQFGASSSGTTDFFVRNNLIAHCVGNDYDVRTVNSVDIDYGLSYSNGTDKINEYGSNGIVADPVFTNELEDDFTITSGSPAVDEGEMFPYGFKFHYYGDAPDIGAYEVGTPTVAIDKSEGKVATGYTLDQNYPNPFNPTTQIAFSIPNNELVTLRVYNVLGQEVSTLVNKKLTSGFHAVSFDASDLSSGMYFYTIKSGSYMKTKKMMLLK